MTDLEPGEFIHVLGDAHVYKTHAAALREQIERKPLPFPLLRVDWDRNKRFEDYSLKDFRLLGYHPMDSIKMDMAV